MSCCVVGCQNRPSDNKGLHFYRIPSTNTSFNANRRRLWLQAIGRTEWKQDVVKNARLCSAHFISGAASTTYGSPDFVPSIFPHARKDPNESKAKLERCERKRKRDDEHIYHRPLMDGGDPQQPIEDEEPLDLTVERCTEATVPKACVPSILPHARKDPNKSKAKLDSSLSEATVPKAVYDELQLNYSQLSTECVNLRTDINKLKAEIVQLKETLRNTEFSYSSFKSKAASVLFFTGLTRAANIGLSESMTFGGGSPERGSGGTPPETS